MISFEVSCLRVKPTPPSKTGAFVLQEFMLGLSILLRGTLDDKLAWVFDLYDNKRRGFIDRDELFIVVQSIYDLMGNNTDPPVHRNSIGEHVNTIFQVSSVIISVVTRISNYAHEPTQLNAPFLFYFLCLCA